MEQELNILYGVLSDKNLKTGQVKLVLTQRSFSLNQQTLIAEHENSDGSVLQQYLAEVESKEVFCGWIDSSDAETIANHWAEQLGGLKIVFSSNLATTSVI